MYARFHSGADRRARSDCRGRPGVRAQRAGLGRGVGDGRGRTDPRSLRVQLRAARSQAQLRYIARLLVDPERRALVAKQDWLNA